VRAVLTAQIAPRRNLDLVDLLERDLHCRFLRREALAILLRARLCLRRKVTAWVSPA
jgi:hypothetical protein